MRSATGCRSTPDSAEARMHKGSCLCGAVAFEIEAELAEYVAGLRERFFIDEKN